MLHTLDWSFNPSGALDFVIIVAASSLVLWVREGYELLKGNPVADNSAKKVVK